MGLFSFFRKRKIDVNVPVIETTSDNTTIQNEVEPVLEEIEPIINEEPSIVEPVEIIEDIPQTVTYEELEDYAPTKDLANYCMPPVDLFKFYDPIKIDKAETEATKNKIISILSTNGIELISINENIGYVNTLYELKPKEGTRVAKLKQLKEDLAFALLSPNLTIELIPERGVIGIIVPNKDFYILPLLPIISSKDFIESDYELPIIIGRTIQTENFIVDLAKQPHILIAGATGQGKSVLLNIILASLLYKKHPAELKLVLIDTRILEFNLYNSIEKHYLAKLPSSNKPVVSDISKANQTLWSLRKEMNDRYELIANSHSRNLSEYNTKFKKRKLNPLKGHRFLPYIVTVIDEYFDLAINKESESYLTELTRKAHIIGIHIILATQRPTKDVITGSLKANFPVQIAFKVASSLESRIIIDKNGAENLSGRGDALYSEGLNTIRIQVPYISTEEVQNIVQNIGEQQGYISAFELPEHYDNLNNYSSSIDLNDLDPLFDEAARLIVVYQQGSTSLIQRKFSIGYNRAGRLMEQLEAAEIVGITQGSKPRDVLIKDEYNLEQKLNLLK